MVKIIVFVGFLIMINFLSHKIKMDNEGLKIWKETNHKLDILINIQRGEK